MPASIKAPRPKSTINAVRTKYWNVRNLLAELIRLFRHDNLAFLKLVTGNFILYATSSLRPVKDETPPRIQAATSWVLHAQRATPDDGVSLGYFPCRRDASPWQPSYPETTGYIITTLLTCAERFNDTRMREKALDMARWEIAIQMPSGAVQGGPVCSAERQTPAAFNTGMVLDGWCSAYSATNDRAFFEAARRAADFLVADIDDAGYFRTNGNYVSADEVKTYTCLCAWAVYRFGEMSAKSSYKQAAIKIIEAATRQQQPNGWFAHNCLTQSSAPLTHTIGYTLQGMLEVGILAQRQDFIEAVEKCVKQLITKINRQGLLAGRYDAEWKPAVRSSCLTGNAQIAIVCYRLYEITGLSQYKEAANTLVNTLKALQTINSSSQPFNGAVAGSFPIFGGYMRGGYPNWATKYFIDALLLQHEFNIKNNNAL